MYMGTQELPSWVQVAHLPRAPSNFPGIPLMYFNISKVDPKVKTENH